MFMAMQDSSHAHVVMALLIVRAHEFIRCQLSEASLVARCVANRHCLVDAAKRMPF